jgi:hypothetical protein
MERRKKMKGKICLSIIITTLCILFISCKKEAKVDPQDSDIITKTVTKVATKVPEVTKPVYEFTKEGIIAPESAKEAISDVSDKVITAISMKDMNALADYVHPDKGVRFTPYTNVNKEKDIIFNQEDIKNFFDNQTVYLWGNYDGSGYEISLTSSQYYDEFIYTSDFLNAEKVGYNEVLSYGNSLENQFEVYEEAIVVEYYFSGFNADYAGLDWQSLRLVYEQYNNEWRLVGIIHNQWTI